MPNSKTKSLNCTETKLVFFLLAVAPKTCLTSLGHTIEDHRASSCEEYETPEVDERERQRNNIGKPSKAREKQRTHLIL